MILRAILRCIAAVVFVVFVAETAHSASLKLAITDVEGMERLQTEWGPFEKALETATGLEFELFAVNSRTAAAEALRAKQIDFVVSGPAEYVVINKLTDAKPLIGLGRPDYYCAIIVMATSDVIKPADLKGKKVAFKDIGSTSGHLCPMQLLMDYGVNPSTDIERIHTSRNVMHEALKRGDVAAIGINHNSWIAKARDKDTSTVPGAFRIIARSGDLPNDMLMVASHVDPKTVEQVRTAMIANKKQIIEAILAHEENLKYGGMDLHVVNDADYDIVRSMYTTAGFPQFDTFIGD